ncbi:MAG TPA: hypothetical protein ENK57_04095 [Polyangiaceae bacterium]|nr:hypothetical protein [Polyangiaceae bacterium]
MKVFAAVQELTRAGAAEAFEIGQTLGEGGMGFVRSARQKSVGRTVAVKTLQPGSAGTVKELRLLREAWLTLYMFAIWKPAAAEKEVTS